MKGVKKCFGLLLLCSITFGLSLSVCSGDINALKHEYNSLLVLNSPLPLRTNSSSRYFDWNSQDTTSNYTFGGSGFGLEFANDAWKDEYSSIRVPTELRYITADLNSSSCDFRSMFTQYYVRGSLYENATITQSEPRLLIGSRSISSSSSLDSSTGAIYVPDYWNVDTCYSINGMTSFNESSADITVNRPKPTSPNPQAFGSLGSFNALQVLRQDNYLPRTFKSGQFTFQSVHRSSNGVDYSRSLSFSTFLSQPIKSFSSLSIGLDDSSGYWTNDSNLYAGRHFDFHFNFYFDSSVQFTSHFQSNGSIKIRASAAPKSVSSPIDYVSFDCTSTFHDVQLETGLSHYWDISCPVDLSEDYIAFVPSLVIDGDGYNVLNTDGDWQFSSLYVISDYDDTRGQSFNSDSRFTGYDIWTDYWDSFESDNFQDADWFSSLTNLFGFNFINPFAPLFELFNSQESCVSIPILSSMLHSEETQVCPWFDSTTRSILTPVLSLSSVMLVFGFAVHWLGARSGNLFEDSVETDNFSFSNKFRRKK